MRIVIVLNDLAMGGTQRLAVGLASHFQASGHAVEILVYDSPDAPRFFTPPAPVPVHSLDLFAASRGPWDALRLNWRRIRKLRAEVRRAKPDLVVSFLATINVTVLLAAFGLRLPVVVAEESDAGATPLPRPWRWLRYMTYRLSRGIVVHANRGADYFRGWAADRVWVIHNPISPCADASGAPAELRVPEKAILGMGRLTAQKAFDVLIAAFGRIAARHPDWQLMILGEGPARSELEQLVAVLDLGRQVSLPGAVQYPGPVLRQGSLFASSSRYEGFCFALGEAMACGLPVVATDAPSGPSDIVRPEVDGLLVPVDDVSALAEALDRAIAAPHLRTEWSRAAREIVQRFSPERVWSEWDALVAAVVGRRGG